MCSAGKFGERWVELAKAYGLNAIVLKSEYGDVVSPDRVEAALDENADAKGVLFQASETSTGAAHDVKSIAAITRKTGALCIVDAITGLGTMPLDIDGWGLDIVDRRFAEGIHDSSGPGLHLGQPEGLGTEQDR